MTKDTKNTTVALANPTVSSNINLSLNQNDMIDLVIEHQLALLTAQLEKIEADLELNNKAIEEVHASAKKSIINNCSKSNTDLAVFNKLIKSHNLKFEDSSSVNLNTYNTFLNGDDVIILGNYDSINIDNVEHYKDPYGYAKRHHATSVMEFHPINVVFVKYKGLIGGLKVEFSDSVHPSIEEQEKYKKALIPLLKKKLAIKKEYAIAAMSYLEYKYGEKRIKSKIVKASLGKSEEGRGILKMLEGATNIKLLG